MADDFLSQLGDALASIAPTAASMLGGPLAGQAVQWVEGQLGVTPDPASSLAQRAQNLLGAAGGMTFDQSLAMKKEDDDLQAKLADANIQLARVDADDRASARAREVAVKDWIPGALMFVTTAGFFGLLAFLASHEVPAGSRDLLNIMLGALGAGWTGGMTYYFGSSAGTHTLITKLAKPDA